LFQDLDADSAESGEDEEHSHSDDESGDESNDNSAMEIAAGHHLDSGDEGENEHHSNGSAEDDNSADSGGYHSVSNSVGGSGGVISESDSEED